MRSKLTAILIAVMAASCAETVDGEVTLQPAPEGSPNGYQLVTITGAQMAQLATNARLLLDLTASDTVYALDGLSGPLPMDRIEVLTPDGASAPLSAWLAARAGMDTSVVEDERVIIAPSKNVTEKPSPEVAHCPCDLDAGKCPCTNTCYVGLPMVCQTSCGCGFHSSVVLDASRNSPPIDGYWGTGGDNTPPWTPKPPAESQTGDTPTPIKPPSKDGGGSTKGGSGWSNGGSSGGSSGGNSGGGSGGGGGGSGDDGDSNDSGNGKPGGWAF